MTSFHDTLWADAAFARQYLDGADHFIPERASLFHVLRSFFRRFVARRDRPARICDLGCGDGILTGQLLALDSPVDALLVDGSPDMLAQARARFGPRDDVRYVASGFEAIVRDGSVLGRRDLILSGFAIHHLARPERQGLLAAVYRQLETGGSFLNVDIGLAIDAAHRDWHTELWREWIDAHGRREGLGDRYHGIPDQAWANPDNLYSPLEEQLADLRAAGFERVECHYRNGMFTVYTGTKPASAGGAAC